MEKYGVGVVGMGWVAGEHIRAWSNNPHTEVVGVTSRTRAGAERRLGEIGLSCKVYETYEALLADPGIQIVSICTPADLHVEQAIAAILAGKHLCLEKAIALDLDGLRQLQNLVVESSIKTVVSFVLRWNPLFETVKQLLADDTIGQVFYAESDYYHSTGPWYPQFDWTVTKRAGGSSLLSAGCHAVDALRWFVGSQAVEVCALSTRSNRQPFDAYEYDPTEVLIVKFKNGALGKVTSSLECRMPYAFNVLLLGDKGTIRNNQLWAKEKFPGQNDYVTMPTILPDSGDVTHHPFQGQIDHFVSCIQQDIESHCNLADAIKTHELCLAADLSAARGGEPIELPLV